MHFGCTKSGGGSKKGCSFSNFDKHCETLGHVQNCDHHLKRRVASRV